MTYRIGLVSVWAAALTACGPEPGTTDGTTIGSSTSGATSDEPTDPSAPSEPSTPSDPSDPTEVEPTTGGPPAVSTVALTEQTQVDVLFVLDNSGSMAEEQATLAASIGALVAGLDGLDWRVGMTTTDAGNPRCPTSTPEDGALVLLSCVDRVAQGEFEFLDQDFSAACTDHCQLANAVLQVTATPTEVDPQLVPRAWVESSLGQLNVGGASATEALQCYLPQGVAGCGFESHLEGMFRALARAQDPEDAINAGFMRQAAVQAVVVVSDETDCSFAAAHQDIFVDNKVFWEDPDAGAPTSAMCWNAGVACMGSAPSWSECHAQNWGADGSPGVDDAEAVLQPVGRYIDFLEQIEQQKQQFSVDAQVVVSLIAGVPVGYESFSAELVYEDSPDPEFQVDFGIGPGCIAGDPQDPQTIGVPPVREREWAEAFAQGDARNLSSICAGDYSAALADVAAAVRDQIRPMCMPNCVADVDPQTAVLEPNCELFEEDLLDQTRVPIARCEESQGVLVPPAGQVVCFGERVDQGGLTPSPLDDMTPECFEEGFNVEFVVVRTVPRAPGVTLSAACELTDDKTKDCPLL